MGIFNFRKKEKNNELENLIREMNDFMYPKGKKDIQAGVNELLAILENKIDEKTALAIFTKSRALANTSQNFSVQVLQTHLQPYALNLFNEIQLDRYYKFLMSCNLLAAIQGKGPSDMRITNGDYFF